MLQIRVSVSATALLLTSLAASAATLTGTIQDPRGSAIAGVAIVISAIPPVGQPKTAQTDASGAFRLGDPWAV